MIRIQLEGIDDLRRGLEDWERSLEDLHGEAVEKVAGQVLAAAQAAAPVKTGALRDSGHLKVSEEAEGRRVDVVFDVPYALQVHESETGTPFLEAPLAAADVPAAVAAELRRRIR